MGKHEPEVSMSMYKACLPLLSLLYRPNLREKYAQADDVCVHTPPLPVTNGQMSVPPRHAPL